MRAMYALILCGLLGACAHPRNGMDLTGAQISYALPKTVAKVGLDLVVTQCENFDKATGTFSGDKVTLRPTATIEVAPVNSFKKDDTFTLRGSDLSSWTETRDVTVELYENRAIKTVNAASADRSMAILTNIVKGVTSLLAVAGAPGAAPVVVCTAPAKAAAKSVALLDKRVEDLRATLPAAKAAVLKETTGQIDAYVNEIARLRASDALHIAIDPVAADLDYLAGDITWPVDSFKKILVTPAQGDASSFLKLGYCVVQATTSDPEAECKPETISAHAKAPAGKKAECPNDAECARTIVLRDPVAAVISVVATGQALTAAPPYKVLKAASFPVSQWADPSYVSLVAGFGGSRTIKLSLDEFGRRTSLGWKSDARAETITGGANGVLEAASALKKSTTIDETAQLKSELDFLDTKQKLNKIKLCEEVILAGGSVCPQ